MKVIKFVEIIELALNLSLAVTPASVFNYENVSEKLKCRKGLEELLTVSNGRTNSGEDKEQGGDKFSKIGLKRPNAK